MLAVHVAQLPLQRAPLSIREVFGQVVEKVAEVALVDTVVRGESCAEVLQPLVERARR